MIDCWLDRGRQWSNIKPNKTIWEVQHVSQTLMPSSLNWINLRDGGKKIEGLPVRVRIQEVTRGQKKHPILMYYGRIKDLIFDTQRIRWPNNMTFLQYSTKTGRDILEKRHPPLQLARSKWQGVLADNFKFRWKNTWDVERVSKKGRLIWQLWHNAVAVNTWRSHISNTIDTTCPVCKNGQEKSSIHRFWDCPQAKEAWRFVEEIMLQLLNVRIPPEPGDASALGQILQMKHAIFADKAPRRFRTISRIWMLARGTILWTLWIARNDCVFNQSNRDSNRIRGTIWKGLSDYARSAWIRARISIRKSPQLTTQEYEKFDLSWDRHQILCARQGDHISWVVYNPHNFVS